MEIFHSRSRKCATLFTAVALVVSGVAFSSAAAHAEVPQVVVETPAGAGGEDVVPTEIGLEDALLDSAESAEEESASPEPELLESDGTQAPLGEHEGSQAPATRPAPAAPSAPPVSQSMTTSAGKASTSLKVTSRSKSKVTAGKKIVVKGKASASLKKKIVKLQIKSGKKWRTVATSRVQSDRTFRLSVKATKAGSQKYRVAHSATSTTNAVATKAFGYTVWKWYSVTGLGAVSSEHSISPATIAGKRYEKSLYTHIYSPERIRTTTFNVNYQCTKFRSYVGLDDSSEQDASVNFALTTDSISTHLGRASLGNPTVVNADISGVYRIGLRTSEDPFYVSAVFANPKVFCKARP